MRRFDHRFTLLAFLFALAGCGGAASTSAIPTSVPQNGQADTRATLSTASPTLTARQYRGTIQDQVPPCGLPSYSCTGAFAISLNRNGTAIYGTWTQDFTNPPLHDEGTFNGTMTGPNDFTAVFSSPTDAPCTITVSGKLTPGIIDAKYIANRSCGYADHGIIVVHHVGAGDD